MKTLQTTLAIFSLILLTACGNTDNIGEPEVVTKESVLVESFEELGKSDHVDIRKAVLEDKTLTITISYSGGCKEHEFTLAGLNAIQKSIPAGRVLTLHHKGNEDMCRELVTETISFDISNLLMGPDEPMNFKLMGYKETISYPL